MNPIPTVDEVRARVASVLQRLESLTVRTSATIEDYPIGGSHRGLCKLDVERNKKGSRTVRTTTNKRGGWCKPHCSTYRGGILCVVTGELNGKTAAWLQLSETGVYLQSANGDVETLFAPVSSCKPRREPHRYSVTSRRMTYDADGLRETVPTKTEYNELPADPPELCAAWDAWVEGRDQIAKLLKDRIGSAKQPDLAVA